MVHGSASLKYKIDPGEGRRPPIFLEMPIERKSASYSGLMEVAFSQHKLGLQNVINFSAPSNC
jgi:hypothetical protein